MSIVTLTSFHRLIVRPRWIRGASGAAKLSVAMMIGGSVMAAYFDLNFELKGYLLILMNDFFTAAYGISIKRALNLNIPQTRCVFHVLCDGRRQSVSLTHLDKLLAFLEKRHHTQRQLNEKESVCFGAPLGIPYLFLTLS